MHLGQCSLVDWQWLPTMFKLAISPNMLYILYLTCTSHVPHTSQRQLTLALAAMITIALLSLAVSRSHPWAEAVRGAIIMHLLCSSRSIIWRADQRYTQDYHTNSKLPLYIRKSSNYESDELHFRLGNSPDSDVCLRRKALLLTFIRNVNQLLSK